MKFPKLQPNFHRALAIALACVLAIGAAILLSGVGKPVLIDGTEYHGCYGIGETPYFELGEHRIESLNSDFGAYIYRYEACKRSDCILINKQLVFDRSGSRSGSEMDHLIFLDDRKGIPKMHVLGSRGDVHLLKMVCPKHIADL